MTPRTDTWEHLMKLVSCERQPQQNTLPDTDGPSMNFISLDAIFLHFLRKWKDLQSTQSDAFVHKMRQM